MHLLVGSGRNKGILCIATQQIACPGMWGLQDANLIWASTSLGSTACPPTPVWSHVPCLVWHQKQTTLVHVDDQFCIQAPWSSKMSNWNIVNNSCLSIKFSWINYIPSYTNLVSCVMPCFTSIAIHIGKHWQSIADFVTRHLEAKAC